MKVACFVLSFSYEGDAWKFSTELPDWAGDDYIPKGTCLGKSEVEDDKNVGSSSAS